MSTIRRQTGVLLSTIAVVGATGESELLGHADCVRGTVQLVGTGGTVVQLQASNDGLTWVNVATTASTNAAVQTSITAAGASGIPDSSQGFNFYRISWSSGAGGSVIVIFVERNRR